MCRKVSLHFATIFRWTAIKMFLVSNDIGIIHFKDFFSVNVENSKRSYCDVRRKSELVLRSASLV